MSDNLLEVKHLKKYFKTGPGQLHAVDDVSFTLGRGRVLGVVGESGCGKSTLGRTILGLHDATDGTILYDGEDITRAKGRRRAALRRKMQIIFQDPFASLNPRMTVWDLIADPIKANRLYSSKEEMNRRVWELMDTVGLARRLTYSYPHELDGGRRQRIGIARALALDPEFIVCDEPVSALDVSIQAQVINTFEELQQKLGISYLFIAHDLLVVQHISKRIAVMYLGRIVETAESDEIINHPQHPYTQSLISAIPIPDPDIAKTRHRIPLEGDVPSPMNMPSGCPFRTRCRYATERCAKECPSLQETAPGHSIACWNPHY